MPSTRQILLGLAVLLASFAAGFLLLHRPPTAPATVAVVAVAAPLTAAPVAAPAPTRSPRHLVQWTTREGAAAPSPELGTLGRTTAADYRRRARFPPSSQPIADGVDPIARDREVTRGRSLGPEGRHPTLVVYPARTAFQAPTPVVVHAYLLHDRARVGAQEIVGEVRSQEGETVAGLVFHDDGLEGDAEADDLLFTAMLVPPPERAHELKGSQLVLVRAQTLAGEPRTATTGFLYSVPLAELTGRYADALADGSLVVSAEVAVAEAGRFHLEATLAARDGTPIAWAQNAATLEAGTAWIPLTYWGLIFHEAQVDGPYVLRSVALSTTGEMPNQKNAVAENAHTTAPYRVAQFDARSFDDPDLLEAAARLEADAPLAGALEAGGP